MPGDNDVVVRLARLQRGCAGATSTTLWQEPAALATTLLKLLGSVLSP